MSELDKIKNKRKVRLLKDVHFDFDGAELSYTLGAASLKDEPYLLKAKEQKLSEEELNILKDLKESSTAHAEEENGGKESSEQQNLNKGNLNKMTESVDLQKQLDDMKHELNVQKAINKTVKYNFEEEVNKDLAEALATIDSEKQDAVFKAFDVLVQKASSKEDKEEENSLKKALDQEEGHAEKQDIQEEEMTLVQKAMKIQEQKGAK